MHHRIKMSYLEPILVHPVRRQIFGDTSGQTFYMTRDPVLWKMILFTFSTSLGVTPWQDIIRCQFWSVDVYHQTILLADNLVTSDQSLDKHEMLK